MCPINLAPSRCKLKEQHHWLSSSDCGQLCNHACMAVSMGKQMVDVRILVHSPRLYSKNMSVSFSPWTATTTRMDNLLRYVAVDI